MQDCEADKSCQHLFFRFKSSTASIVQFVRYSPTGFRFVERPRIQKFYEILVIAGHDEASRWVCFDIGGFGRASCRAVPIARTTKQPKIHTREVLPNDPRRFPRELKLSTAGWSDELPIT